MAVNIGITKGVGGKLLMIGLMAIGLLVPASMVKGLVIERQLTRDAVIKEIGSKWGASQNIVGPILTIPYTVVHIDQDGKEYTTTQYAQFLPEALNIKSVVTPEIRYRGIYEAVLYNTIVLLGGHFIIPDFNEHGISNDRIRWDKAMLSVEITDPRGIRKSVVSTETASLDVRPANGNGGIVTSGISASIPGARVREGFSFTVELDLRGSEDLLFVPLGKTTSAEMQSEWDSPSFTGQYLPEERELHEQGFSASWSVLQINRSFPQSWVGSSQVFKGATFGAKFIVPADGYQKTMRMTKYAILFIFLAFFSFFLIEVLSKKNIHPVQYLLIGAGLVVFYSLLLSITEHAGFTIAYAVASLMLILMITAYAWSILSDKRLAGVICAVLAILYGFMFIVLQAADYALLGGSLGLFAIIAVTMYITRHVNWYALEGSDPAKTEIPEAE